MLSYQQSNQSIAPTNALRPSTTSTMTAVMLVAVVLVTLASLIVSQVAPQSVLDFRDPLVWNPNSLYAAPTHSTARLRLKRAAPTHESPPSQPFVDACQSKMEVVTPYYATNSKGKLRTIVNSELMQQAVQVETCVRSSTSLQGVGKCNAQPDCGCEQKYKWHRLLVLDPHESGAGKGLFMDWFLFPSNCVCRCRNPLFGAPAQTSHSRLHDPHRTASGQIALKQV